MGGGVGSLVGVSALVGNRTGVLARVGEQPVPRRTGCPNGDLLVRGCKARHGRLTADGPTPQQELNTPC